MDTRLKIARLGCFAQVIEYIRGNEEDETLQALGMLVIRVLVGNDVSLKQLFLAHGGMNLIMALHQYKEGVAKQEAALTMFTFRRGQFSSVCFVCLFSLSCDRFVFYILTLVMTSAQVVATSVNVTLKSPSQDNTHPRTIVLRLVLSDDF